MAEPQPQPDKTVLQKVAGVLLDFGKWLRKQVLEDHDRTMKAIADDLGGSVRADAPAWPQPTLSGLQGFFDTDTPNPGLEAWIAVLADVRSLVESGKAVGRAIDLGPEATAEEVAQSVLDLLTSNYVRERWFQLYLWMELARFSTEPMTLYGPQGTASKRLAGSFKALLRFLLAPLTTLAGPPMQTEADARKWSDATLMHLAGVLAFFGHSAREAGLDLAPDDQRIATQDPSRKVVVRHLLKAFYGWDQPAPLRGLAADDVSDRMLSVQFSAPPQELAGGGVALEGGLRSSLAWVPAEHGGKGLFVSFGAGALRGRVGLGERWALHADARFDAPVGVQIGGAADNFRAVTPPGDFNFHLDVALASKEMPPGTYGFRLSLGGDSGLQIGRIALSGALDRAGAQVQLTLHDCRLALDGAAFDDFIGSLLPRTQTAVTFSFGVGASTRDGLFTTGDLPQAAGGAAPQSLAAPAPRRALARDIPLAGGEVPPPPLPVAAAGLGPGGLTLPLSIGKSLGPVTLHQVLLRLDRDGGPAPRAALGAAVSFSAALGPLTARVEGLGLKLALSVPEDRADANLHFAHLDVGFAAPTGVALAVHAEQVQGGGFLFRDDARQLYAGVMELSLSGVIALKAVGLLVTGLPDGRKGFSLLVMVTAESTSENGSLMELPMGWRLTGLGGLIALHRTFDADALRAGIRDRTLDSLLFPKDLVRNAPTVLAALERVFPIRRGSHLFGLVVRLVWGMPVIIRLDLALVLELGARRRFIVLGRLQSILPRRDHDLLRLNLDAVGIFDFDQGTAEIDAVLVDSRLLNRFPITGAGALRARWSSPRSFALAVGGLHKGFNPPAGFPKLERVALSLTTGDNPRLRCEAYFALTSNSVQFGAHAELYASAHGFSVLGEAGFDVLIRLVPFHFLAEFHAGMQLRKGSRNLFKVKVEGALEGPVPLALRARCSFEILWWDVSIRVAVTLAGGVAPPLPPAIDVLAQLRAALADARNWSAELPAAAAALVKLREAPVTAGPAVRVHPLGTLSVRQSVVPLNLKRDIDKFGDSPVQGARRFTLTSVAVGGSAPPSTRPIAEDFAPAQFFEMDDDARIASPSFEAMPAGLRLGEPGFAFDFAQRIESPLAFETRTVDRLAAVPPPPPSKDYRLGDAVLAAQVRHGAAALSPLRRLGLPTRGWARLEVAGWTAAAADLRPEAGAPRRATFAEAQAAPRLSRKRLVVRESELQP